MLTVLFVILISFISYETSIVDPKITLSQAIRRSSKGIHASYDNCGLPSPLRKQQQLSSYKIQRRDTRTTKS